MKYLLLLLSFFILTTNLLYAQQKHEYTVSAYSSYDLYIKRYSSLSGFSIGSKFGVRNRRNNYWQFGGFYSYVPYSYKCIECPVAGWNNGHSSSSNIYELKYHEHAFTVSVDFTYEYLKRKNMNLYFSIGRMFTFLMYSHGKYSYWKVDNITGAIDPGPYYTKDSRWGDFDDMGFAYNLNTGAEFSLSHKLTLFIEPAVRAYFDYSGIFSFQGFSINLLAGIKFKELKKKKEAEK